MTIQGTVTLKQGRDHSIKRFHPWIFSGGIESIQGSPKEGDWVAVQNTSKKILGYGHYQKGTITVRVISFLAEAPNENLYTTKLKVAFLQRKETRVLSAHTNSFRLVHGEGDGLPGLIIDLYLNIAVVQAHSIGMHNDRQLIAAALVETLGSTLSAVYYKSQSTLSLDSQNEYLYGMAAVPHTILEHGNKFLVDWEEGQKTGFFLDQRESRKLVGEMAQNKKVLNTFCYTGGFSVYALQGGAEQVDSVDASERAVEMTRKNIALNGFDTVKNESIAADTFDFIKDRKGVYDLIILDPPAFAKHKEARHQAMKGYQRLNAEAMRIIKPGGIIFTFSCSQVVDRQLFYDTVVSSAIQAGRIIKVLHHLSQPSDHPVSIFHPEGEYLKGLVLFIE